MSGNYPLWSQPMLGTAVGSFFGYVTRLAGAGISPGDPHLAQTMWPFPGSWFDLDYENIQTNQVGSFFLQRLINGVLVGILVTILQEPASPGAPAFFSDPGSELVSNDDRIELNWLDTNLAGTDPIVQCRAKMTVGRPAYGY